MPPLLSATPLSSWSLLSSSSTSLFLGEGSRLVGRCGEGSDDLREEGGGAGVGEVGERIGEVGETMSGTGDSSRFSKLGRSGTGGRRENCENWFSWLDREILWYLFCPLRSVL